MIAKYETNLKYRRRDENGDMVWGHGQQDYLSGLDAMAEVIKTRLGAIQGEWWEGDSTALPYYTEILTAYRTDENKSKIDLMIIERLMSTRGVLSVTNISSFYSGRNYTFKANVNTVYGTTRAEVTL